MPPQKTFDPRQALDRVMHLFWRRGYSETSMDDIVRETGVSRYGLYATFGDKDALFDRALAHYRDTVIGPRLALLEAPDAGADAIRSFFRALVGRTAASGRAPGCFLTKTCAASEPRHAPLARVDEFLNALRQSLERAFQNAHARGEIPTEVDPLGAASVVTMLVVGGSVLAGGGVGREHIELGVRAALSAFGIELGV